MKQLNLNNLPLNRLKESPETPSRIYLTEGADFISGPKDNPYEIELYSSISEAIRLGIINAFTVKGTFDDDQDALNNGLVIGDIYELSETNSLDPAFYGLLKVVKTNVVIIPEVIGTGVLNQTIGTGVPNQIIGI